MTLQTFSTSPSQASSFLPFPPHAPPSSPNFGLSRGSTSSSGAFKSIIQDNTRVSPASEEGAAAAPLEEDLFSLISKIWKKAHHEPIIPQSEKNNFFESFKRIIKPPANIHDIDADSEDKKLKALFHQYTEYKEQLIENFFLNTIPSKEAPAIFNKSNICSFISGLSQLSPELIENFFEYSGGTYFINLKGLIFLVDKLKTNGILTFPCEVCSQHTFEQRIKEIRQKEDNENFPIGTKQGFIVECNELKSSKGSAHFSPIYMEKTEAGWETLHSDAVGDKRASLLPDIIKRSFPEICLYIGGEGRQRDGQSCSMFSVLDMVNISKHPEFFSEIKNSFSFRPGRTIPLTLTDLPYYLQETMQRLEDVETSDSEEGSDSSDIEEDLPPFSVFKSLTVSPSSIPESDKVRRRRSSPGLDSLIHHQGSTEGARHLRKIRQRFSVVVSPLTFSDTIKEVNGLAYRLLICAREALLKEYVRNITP